MIHNSCILKSIKPLSLMILQFTKKMTDNCTKVENCVSVVDENFSKGKRWRIMRDKLFASIGKHYY